MRSLILKKEIKEQPNIDFYGLKNEMNANGRNLNQLVKKANSNILDVDNINNCISKLYEVLKRMEEMLGI